MPKIIDEQAENGLFKFVFTPFVERCGMLLGVWWHLAATENETPIERVIGIPACAISVATESVPSNQLHDPDALLWFCQDKPTGECAEIFSELATETSRPVFVEFPQPSKYSEILFRIFFGRTPPSGRSWLAKSLCGTVGGLHPRRVPGPRYGVEPEIVASAPAKLFCLLSAVAYSFSFGQRRAA